MFCYISNLPVPSVCVKIPPKTTNVAVLGIPDNAAPNSDYGHLTLMQHSSLLWGNEWAGGSIIGKKQKRERCLLIRYHLPLWPACQRSRNNSCQEPRPRSLVTITCDNWCVILSSAWHPPQGCVITDDCHNFVPSHGEASDLNRAAVNLQNFTC